MKDNILIKTWSPVVYFFLHLSWFQFSLWLKNATVHMYYIFYIHLSINRYLGWFQLLIIVNSARETMEVYVVVCWDRDLQLSVPEWQNWVR